MTFGMHFINCKAGIFKELRLSGPRICAELTSKIVDDYFGCLFEIHIQGREHVIPSFGNRNLVETKADEMRTPNCHDSSSERLLAVGWIVFLAFAAFSRIDLLVVISPVVKCAMTDGRTAIETSSLFPFAKWGRTVFASTVYDVTAIDEIVERECCSVGECSRQLSQIRQVNTIGGGVEKNHSQCRNERF